MVGEDDAAADDAERALVIARSMGNPILAGYALGQSAFTLASATPNAPVPSWSSARRSSARSATAMSTT